MREERVGGEDNKDGERGKSSNKPMYVPSMYVRMYMCTVHTSLAIVGHTVGDTSTKCTSANSI